MALALSSSPARILVVVRLFINVNFINLIMAMPLLLSNVARRPARTQSPAPLPVARTRI